MASWAPPLRPPRRAQREPERRRPDARVLRVGRHVVSDRDLLVLAYRLRALEHELDATVARDDEALQARAHECVARDLEVVTTALRRARLPAH